MRTVEPIPLPGLRRQRQKRRPLLSVHGAIIHVQKDEQRERPGARSSIQFVVSRRKGRVWGKEGGVDVQRRRQGYVPWQSSGDYPSIQGRLEPGTRQVP